jgi:hypothetical protein
MATLVDLRLRVAQTERQKKLDLVELTYGYRLVCTDVERERGASFEVSVDVLGHDPLRDDLLAERLDMHILEAAGPDGVERTLLLGSALLDEDVGDDEIKLRIRARDTAGDVVEAMTPIVHGRF